MEDRVTAFARESFPQMSEEERREAIRSLRKLIDEEVFAMASGDAGGEPPEKCPRCGHWHVVKRGRTSGGAQRYLCRSCSHTFTESTLKVFATTKLERGTWMRYAECHVDLCTLREVREKCGVSLKTAWFMRHRVLEAISASMPPFRSSAGDGMQVDETYLRESFKGNRKNAECGIPRKARRRHEGVDNYEQICVLTGVNDAGDMFFEMAGRGNITDDRAAEFLSGKVASGAIVSTDGSRAYPNVLKALDVRRHDVSPSGAHGINVVNWPASSTGSRGSRRAGSGTTWPGSSGSGPSGSGGPPRPWPTWSSSTPAPTRTGPPGANARKPRTRSMTTGPSRRAGMPLRGRRFPWQH